MKHLLLAALLLASHAFAQVKNVTKTISTNGLVENLVVPSGKTLTINSGGSIINNGTATGFTATAAWGSITGTLSSQTDLQTALDAKQPLDGGLTALASLADASGVLTNNGSGTLSYTATSAGGNFMADAGKIARYDDFGNISASLALYVRGPSGPSAYPQASLATAGLFFFESASNFTVLSAATMTGGKYVRIPAVGSEGSPATLISNADTGTVTDTMLAGSIAISKLAITGTPDGTKYLRDDGTWQTVSSGATLSANTFTATQTITPAANTNALAVSSYSLTSNNAQSLLNLTGTWNTSGTPSAIFCNITDTASNASSLLLQLQTGGTNRMTLTKAGVATIGSSAIGGGGTVLNLTSSYGTFTANILGGGVLSTSQSISTAGTVVAATLALNNDALLNRDAAAVVQLGSDAASPTAQTLKAHDGSGTNADGASLTLSGGNSTGTGDDGDVILRSTMTGSSGSSANTQQTRAQVVARFKNLTEGAATDVVSIALGSGKVTGGTATLTVWASDGTDHQALTSEIRFAAVNKAGTVTATCTQTDGTTAASAGTLTVTYDATTTGNNVILRANATSSLTQTILRSRLVITALNGDDTQVVSPQ